MNVKKLIKLGACREAVSWAEEQADDTSAWIACERGDWMLWLLGKLSGPAWGERRKLLVLAACECARLALPYTHGKQIETYIETVEAWTRGEATQTQVRNAYDAAAAATNAAAFAFAFAAGAAADAAAAAAAAASFAFAAAASATAAANAAAFAFAAAASATAAANANAANVAAFAANDAAAAAAAAANDAAAAAAATNAAAATARSRTLHLCADIVRKHYPNPPIL